MGLFDIFKRNKEFENKKDDLFSIPCDYDGYDFVFKSNITNPSIYDEITKILTNDKMYSILWHILSKQKMCYKIIVPNF